VSQVNFPRPHAPAIGDRLHEMESGELVPIGRRSKIFLKIDHFLFVIRDYLIRNHRQVGIPIV